MNKKRPIIGVSGGMQTVKEIIFPGLQRAYVNNDYIESIINSNGIPIILPIPNKIDVVKDQVDIIDGLILSGGHDLNPLLWGEEPTQKLGEILPKRDEFDIALVKYATKLKKPILGICRGMQLINVAFGGTLYQDLSYINGCNIKHNQINSPSVPTHTVNIKKDTILHNIFGNKIITNSFHHLAVNNIAKGFKISAYSQDGIIEAIEREDDKSIIAVQWHPEMMTEKSDNMQKLFDWFINEVCVNDN